MTMLKLLTIHFFIAAVSAGALQPRIIDGHYVTAPWFPYVVSIQRAHDLSHFCAGSFITADWILTAAHCFVEECPDCRPEHLLVVSTTLNIDHSSGLRYLVHDIIVHEEYDYLTDKNDIALVEIVRDFFPNDYSQRIRLGISNIDDIILVPGWGSISRENVTFSSLMKFSYLQTTDSSEYCENDKHFLCAQVLDKGGPCVGDCGGPCVVKGIVDTLVGIVTHEEDCGNGVPQRFTRVSTFISWIASKIDLADPRELLV